jgi:hypothetical protein
MGIETDLEAPPAQKSTRIVRCPGTVLGGFSPNIIKGTSPSSSGAA